MLNPLAAACSKPLTSMLCVAIVAIALSSVGCRFAAAVELPGDQLSKEIQKAPDSSFTLIRGGFANALGFKKYEDDHFAVYYASGEVGADEDLDHVDVVDGRGHWTFTYDSKGRVNGFIDASLDALTLIYNHDGSIFYRQTMHDGLKKIVTSGTVPASELAKLGRAERAPERLAPIASDLPDPDPIARMKIQVQACSSWPTKPLSASLGYTDRRGKAHYESLSAPTVSGSLYTYQHTIDPLYGIRTLADARETIQGIGCVAAGAGLFGVCTFLSAGGGVLPCAAAGLALAYTCGSVHLTSRSIGLRRDQILAALPNPVILAVYVGYRTPRGAEKVLTRSRVTYWSEQKTYLLKIQLPCWNVYQGDFLKHQMFTNTQPNAQPPVPKVCHPYMDLGERLYVIVPVSGDAGDPLVQYDNYQHWNYKKYCYGDSSGRWTIYFNPIINKEHVKASLTTDPPYVATHKIDIVLGEKSANGTVGMKFDFPNCCGGRAFGNTISDVALAIVRGY